MLIQTRVAVIRSVSYALGTVLLSSAVTLILILWRADFVEIKDANDFVNVFFSIMIIFHIFLIRNNWKDMFRLRLQQGKAKVCIMWSLGVLVFCYLTFFLIHRIWLIQPLILVTALFKYQHDALILKEMSIIRTKDHSQEN